MRAQEAVDHLMVLRAELRLAISSAREAKGGVFEALLKKLLEYTSAPLEFARDELAKEKGIRDFQR